MMRSLKSVQFWVWMLVLIASALRVREFLASRSLWLDEVALLLQIKRRSYEALLLNGVGGNQGAPAAYLLLSKLSLGQFSSLEFGARFAPLLAGIGTMVASAWLVTISLRNTMTRILGLVLIGSSPWLIYYSAEGKHYMQEVLIALLLVCVSIRYEQGKISLFLLGVLGMLSVWFSHNAPTVLCACGALLFAKVAMGGDRTGAVRLLCIFCSWIVSFALHASTTMRALFGNRELYNHWGHGLAPWRKGVSAVVPWMGDVWGRLMEYAFIPADLQSAIELLPSGSRATVDLVLLTLVVLGIVRMFRERSALAPYIPLILGVSFSLALLRISPFSSRLLLYVVPFLLLSAASGLTWLFEIVRDRGALLASVGVGAFIFVVGPSVALSTERFIRPFDRTDMKGALRYLVGARSPGELVVMRRSDATVATLYAKRDRSVQVPFLDANWKIAKPRTMCARLRKKVLHAQDQQIWIVGVLKAAEVSGAVDAMERECAVVGDRFENGGFFAARLRLRR
ncbi:MAG: hypothetical protein RL518_134 [Pseudomonadota bacterium]